MKNLLVIILSFLVFTSTAFAANTRVVMKTTMGEVTIELFDDRAPATVKNFLKYVDEGFYNGTIFHRVIAGFMVQGGGMVAGLQQKRTHQPILNEAANRLPNVRGTLAMARTMDPHSATAQFFINVVDNPFLNFRDASTQGYGYCVFGRVTAGMEVVDKIRAVKTGTVGPFSDVPVKDVVILSIKRK
ncbi:MAG TPA: peptidyl-prolyl cis-trans isomerase [Spirochaetes bacterium]|nr:peptidyl-prolyl cis-trans isomerase [Spirochaetota bacterium]